MSHADLMSNWMSWFSRVSDALARRGLVQDCAGARSTPRSVAPMPAARPPQRWLDTMEFNPRF